MGTGARHGHGHWHGQGHQERGALREKRTERGKHKEGEEDEESGIGRAERREATREIGPVSRRKQATTRSRGRRRRKTKRAGGMIRGVETDDSAARRERRGR